MGLIKAAIGSVGGVLSDQWKEYIYCEALDNEILVSKGRKKTSNRSSNTKSDDNIISTGSIVAVADGQCMIIVENGKVTEVCATPGEFEYNSESEPSIFTGDLDKQIEKTFINIGKRFTFGGQPANDQRVYYFNTKEILANKYGTPQPIPFRVVDANIGLDMDIEIRCHGEYSFKIIDPLLFYTNVSGNVTVDYNKDEIMSQLKSELLTALMPAFAKISAMGIRYSSLMGHTMEMADALNEVLSKKWTQTRGIKIASFGISSLKASEEDENMIQELQRNATFRNPNMAAAHLVGAQASAMQSAAENQGSGAMMGFMGMNMAQNAGGMNAQNLYTQATPQQVGWNCKCGQTNNTGNFCGGCGSKKAQAYVCKKCGHTQAAASKFCPQCGDAF